MGDRRKGKGRRSTAQRAAPRAASAPPVASGGAGGGDAPWTLLAHPCFLDQFARLTEKAAAESGRGGGGEGAAIGLLGHVLDLVFSKIPQDPGNPSYRHGGALGSSNRHWFRAKTGGGRFRLFYRFSSSARIIVYGWLNDEQSLRTYGATSDAYAVFARMLGEGSPPSDWEAFVAAASSRKARTRLAGAAAERRSGRTSR